MEKLAHLMYTPFTGLGLYNGHRGRRWLRNRIKIFKQFVVPSLLNQTNQNFILWVSWRHEDRGDQDILDLHEYLLHKFDKVVFTYSGVCFWDDKYEDDVAYDRLVSSVHGAIADLLNFIGEAETVLMTIQPSDDCYWSGMVEETQRTLEADNLEVFGYKRGYVMDYTTGKTAYWNPSTTPPFYTIKFPREVFMDPMKHVKYTGPYKSHEYVKDYLNAYYSDFRGFIVGTHGENISTVFNHPFAQELPEGHKPQDFPTFELLKLKTSLRKKLMRKLPHGWQRKLRYWLGERFYAKVYNWLRS